MQTLAQFVWLINSDGYSFTQDGTLNKPFWQSTLSRNSVSDPSAYVYSATTEYDLRWGTPDKNGPSYAALFQNGTTAYITLNSTLNYWGNIVGGQTTVGPTIATPHADVIAAWQSGWTGAGVNVLMEDALTSSSGSPTHAVTTAMLVTRYAIGSTIYGFNNTTQLGIYNLNGSVASPSSMVNIGVINSSWGENIWAYAGHSGPFTAAEMTAAFNSFIAGGRAQSAVSRYTGVTGFTNFNYSSAVVVKSAGNDSVTADNEALAYTLAHTASLNSRLLVVGALTQAGFVSSPTSIASYSNTAGTDSLIQNRFVVASGVPPFSTGDVAVNGVALSGATVDPATGVTLGNAGTSYAAPRVAGYVAILRSKFPNLDAVNSSSIMLDTARYDTLTCNPNCDPAIYGKGEVSLSRALAPVGRLR